VEQIAAMLKQGELGVPVAAVIRKVGITEQTFYRWKKQYVGLETDHARQMKQLQEENSRLKQLVADLSLDKTCATKKVLKPSGRRPMVDHLRDQYRASERHVCRVLLRGRGTSRYQSHPEPWTELRMRIREISQSRCATGTSTEKEAA
jgi:putative transposase